MKCLIASFTILSLLLTCAGAENSSEVTSRHLTIPEARQKGREITAIAGATLISKVGEALAKRDAAYAVRFCNLAASPLIDSINQANNCTVHRITNQMRNPANTFQNSLDARAWEWYAPGDKTADTVLVSDASEPFYYKPIHIPSDLCLQCHGSRDQDIAPSTLAVIDSLYPEDTAVGYEVGRLRGMWKVSFAR